MILYQILKIREIKLLYLRNLFVRFQIIICFNKNLKYAARYQ